MKPKILFTLIASFAFLFVFQQSIRAEKYPFRNYSVDDGLPHSSVKKIFQDRDGYMWFGTAGGGVSRFDGRNFTNYSTRDGLPYNWIGSILQDSEGNLWFVTGSGVSKFDGPSRSGTS